MHLSSFAFLVVLLHIFQASYIDGVLVNRNAATNFHVRTKRGLQHECYEEAPCSYEEVREVYEDNTAGANEYWYDYKCDKQNIYCKVNCYHRKTCEFTNWGSWVGNVGDDLGCYKQQRSKSFKHGEVLTKQRSNCNGLKTNCQSPPSEERRTCRCLQETCDWSAWYKDGVEEHTNCKLLSRVHNVTVSSNNVGVIGSCDSVNSNCDSEQKETVKDCASEEEGEKEGETGEKEGETGEEEISTTQPPSTTTEPFVEKSYVSIGCYKDDKRPRALKTLIKNLRSSIDWYNMKKTIQGCVDAAREKGYSYVGIQFFGECWVDKDAVRKFDMHGEATDCWNGVGKQWTNFVYKITG